MLKRSRFLPRMMFGVLAAIASARATYAQTQGSALDKIIQRGQLLVAVVVSEFAR